MNDAIAPGPGANSLCLSNPLLTLQKTEEEIKAAAYELWEANAEVEEAMAVLNRARRRRHDADVCLARVAPWSAEDQYIQIIAPDHSLVLIKGEPAELGNDCHVLPLRRIEDLAQLKCDRAADSAAKDDLPF